MTTAPRPQQPFVPVPPATGRPPSVFRQHFVALLVAGVVLVLAIAALAVWSFTSIVSNAHPTTTSAVQAPVSAPVSQTSSTGETPEDQQFLGMLRALPDVPAVTNPTSMIAGAHDVCADMSRGMGAGAEMYSVAGQANISTNAAGEIVGAAIMSYCPQYRAAAGL